MIYLRLVEYKEERRGDRLDVFIGDINKDREYWEKERNCKVRYFKLEEMKDEKE